jgi:hypothetical protein
VSYSYDQAGRLTGVSDTSAAVATEASYATSYGYDARTRRGAILSVGINPSCKKGGTLEPTKRPLSTSAWAGSSRNDGRRQRGMQSGITWQSAPFARFGRSSPC